MAAKEEQCPQSLILGGGADILTYREMSEKGVDLGLTHIRGMVHLIKESGRSIHPNHVGPWLYGGE